MTARLACWSERADFAPLSISAATASAARLRRSASLSPGLAAKDLALRIDEPPGAVAFHAHLEPGELAVLAPRRRQRNHCLRSAVSLRDRGQRLGLAGFGLVRIDRRQIFGVAERKDEARRARSPPGRCAQAVRHALGSSHKDEVRLRP